MISWIITGVVALPFILLAIFLLNGKGSFLIAGFNTMNRDEKAKYDEKALCKAVGWLMVVLTVLILLFPLSITLGQMWIFWVIFVLFMTATIGFAVYANTGNRFRIDIDPNEEPVKKEPQPMSRMKKLAIIIFIVISAQVTVGIGIMIVMGERDPVVTIENNGIKISALYGTTINFASIAEVSLIDKPMQEIGIGTRTNGYSTNGLALKGNFNSAAYGIQLLFVYSSSSPTIQITPTAGATIFISFRDSETTRSVYREISAAIS